MALKAYAPGTRKGNRTYIFRGRIDGGKPVEITTDLPAGTPARKIQQALAEAERSIRAEREKNRIPGYGEVPTFERAAELYIAYRQPDRANRNRLARMIAASEFSSKRVNEIIHADIIALANKLMPTAINASKNRGVLVLATAVLHYAANNGWCPWVRVSKFQEPTPKTRAVSDGTAEMLIDACPEGSREQLFLLWLFRQGNRVSDPLPVLWDHIDLERETVQMHIKKTDQYREKPLHPDVVDALRAIPKAERQGKLFKWNCRQDVYRRWLNALTARLGIRFTPHMARHTLGRQLNAKGAAMATIMGALDHADVKSSIRYQHADVEVVRSAISQVGQPRRAKKAASEKTSQPETVGKAWGKRRKSLK